MPSLSFETWSVDRAAILNGVERVHRTVRGTGPGARAVSLLANQTYALMLSAQFQGFCRDLHSECAGHLVSTIPDPNLRMRIRENLIFGRRLNHGNANPSNIGADFNRFVLGFWPLVEVHRPQNAIRKILLEELNQWRNAIAHDDYSAPMLRGSRPALTLAQVQGWRRACDGLARSFDEVMRLEIRTLIGAPPW